MVATLRVNLIEERAMAKDMVQFYQEAADRIAIANYVDERDRQYAGRRYRSLDEIENESKETGLRELEFLACDMKENGEI